jgi:hypothetical protein
MADGRIIFTHSAPLQWRKLRNRLHAQAALTPGRVLRAGLDTAVLKIWISTVRIKQQTVALPAESSRSVWVVTLFATRVMPFISWFMQLWRVNWKKLKIFYRKWQDDYEGWGGEEELLADCKKCSTIFLYELGQHSWDTGKFSRFQVHFQKGIRLCTEQER